MVSKCRNPYLPCSSYLDFKLTFLIFLLDIPFSGNHFVRYSDYCATAPRTAMGGPKELTNLLGSVTVITTTILEDHRICYSPDPQPIQSH